MPPASRGTPLLRFLRQYSQTRRPSQTRKPRPITDIHKPVQKYKSSPFASRQPVPLRPPSLQNVTAASQSTSLETTSEVSRLNRLLRRIPFRVRRYVYRSVLLGPPLLLLLLHFPLEIMWVNGPSMSPFLNPNSADTSIPETRDCVLVHKNMFPDRKIIGLRAPFLTCQRGQIVVFYTPHNPNKIAVKRIVGIPGDRIQPLPGYPGGDEPVLVPYNHLWVEGDVDNRDKSVDSNWYGPISQTLVIGVVNVVLSPWYAPSLVRWNEHTYPAKEKGRVEEDVVKDAAMDPYVKDEREKFLRNQIGRDLEQLQAERDTFPNRLKNETFRRRVQAMYVQISQDIASGSIPDRETLAAAQDFVEELEAAFVKSGLTSMGQVPQPQLSGSELEKQESEESRRRNESEAAERFRRQQEEDERAETELAKMRGEGPAARALRKKLDEQRRESAVREAEAGLLDEWKLGWMHGGQMNKTGVVPVDKATGDGAPMVRTT